MATLNITPAAAEQIQRVLDERGQGLGLRVSVKPSGCPATAMCLILPMKHRMTMCVSKITAQASTWLLMPSRC